MYLRKKKISLAETCSRFEEKDEEKELSWLMFFLTSWPEPQHPGLVLLREAPTETGRLPHNRQAFIFSSKGYLASLVTVPKPSRILCLSQQSCIKYLLEMMWRKGSPPTLLVRK